MFGVCDVNEAHLHKTMGFPINTDLCSALTSALTLQAVSVQQVLTLLMTLDATFSAAHALTRNAPQQSLTLGAVGGSRRCPHLKMMWRRR